MGVKRIKTWASPILVGVVCALALGVGHAAVFPGALNPGAKSLGGEERAAVLASLGKLPLSFIENRGQTDARAGFYLQSRERTIYFTPTGVVFVLGRPEPAELEPAGAETAAGPPGGPRGWVVQLDFLGVDGAVRPAGRETHAGVVSYFKGPQENWRSGVPTFGSIVYAELWPGIDLVFSGEGGVLKATYHVKPGADPGLIRLAYRGAEEVGITATGRLRIVTPLGGFEEDTPYAFQELDGGAREVAAEFTLEKEATEEGVVYGFRLGAYDRAQTLVLDPAVICGYIGGAGNDFSYGIAVDNDGSIYFTGQSYSAVNFPIVAGGFDGTLGGTTDLFVAKVNPAMTGLVYCSFLGGSGNESGYKGIAVDGEGSAYLAGWTSSADFPVAGGWPYTAHGGGTNDGFVAKVNAAGTALVYSGYLGGSGNFDYVRDIAVDSSGCAYLVGYTDSTNFPTTSGAFDTTHGGGTYDSFVAKVNAAGTALVYSTFIGGSGSDQANGIAVDTSGNAYVVGSTSSTQATFPVTVGPDLTSNGNGDVFVAKVNANGTALVYCGYIGGSVADQGFGIAVDASGNAYVTGVAASTETTFPVTVGPDLTHNGGTYDAFVAKVNAAGTALDYCGYIGGSGLDQGVAIAVDTSGSAYVVGHTPSNESSFPVTGGPDLTYNGGTNDVFVAKVKADGSALVYCGYIGGSGDDKASGIAVDGRGAVYIGGQTPSTEATFPVAGGPDLTHNGSSDAFVAKITPYLGPLVAYTEYASATDDIIRSRSYLGAAWTGEGAAYDSDDTGALKWHTAATNAEGTRQAVLAVGSGANTLYAALYDGWIWSTHNLGALPTSDTRCFAAAYEQASGRLMVAAATSTANQIKYWVHDGDSWVVNGSTYSSAVLNMYSGFIVLRMDAQPGSNQIGLIGKSGNNQAGALIWDGSAWGSDKQLSAAGPFPNNTSINVDVKYMRAGAYAGQALFVWQGGSTLLSWSWSGSAWAAARQEKASAAGGTILWLELAADPSSSKLLAALGDSNEYLYTVDWTGSSWGTARSVSADLLYTVWYGRRFAVSFESGAGHLGHAVIAYSDSANLKYRHTSDVSGAWGSETSLDADADCNFLALARDAEKTLHLVCQADEVAAADTLKAYRWDNSAWTSLGRLEGDLQSDSNGTYEAFAITACSERIGLDQAHYRWRRDDGSENSPAFRVQSFQGTLGAGETTKEVAIDQVYRLDRAFILAPGGRMSVGVGYGNVNMRPDITLTRARFSNDSTVALERAAGFNDSDSSYSFFVIEDRSGNEINVVSGTHTFAAPDGILKIDIEGISEPEKAVVFLTVSSDAQSNDYSHEAHVRGYLSGSSQLVLERTSGDSSVTVDWFVVEFIGSGWSVQQGYTALETGVHDSPQSETIGAVDPAAAFVFMNWSADFSGLDPVSPKARLADATTLEFSRQTTTLGRCDIQWFVVSHASLAVQRGAAAAGADDGSLDQTITAIDRAAAFPVSFNDIDGTGTAFPRPYWRAWFANSRTLRLSREYTGKPSNFFWQVVDLSGFGKAGGFPLSEDAKAGVNKLEPLRLRLLVANQGSLGASTGFQLRVAETASCASGTYFPVGGSGAGAHWAMAASGHITDGEASANVDPGLTDPPGYSFVAGELKESGSTTGAITLAAGSFTELEFSLQATSSATAGGDYCFRLYTSGGQPLEAYSQDAEARVNGVTAIRLLEFAARGEGGGVGVVWTTGQEARNKGFDLFRAEHPSGPWVKLNTQGLIGSESESGEGRGYRFLDAGAEPGRIYYYRLEDVDTGNARTAHGPVCVDWDGDGLPDDWEIAHGLNPAVNNADLDPDGDGVPNWLEYARGSHPRQADGSGTGGSRERPEAGVFEQGIRVIAADATGVTLELVTGRLDVSPVEVGGQAFERLRLPGAVHGYTLEPGRPQLPVKGMLLDIPEGKRAQLELLETASRSHAGYRVYPAPEHRGGEQGRVAEVFVWDQAAYGADGFYPGPAAALSLGYLLRGELKQRLVFHPVQFNPATGELLHHERIRLRVSFTSEPDPFRAAAAASSSGWRPPAGAAYKLMTREEGLYRITREWLAGQGLSAAQIDAIDLRGVQLFNLGEEQALWVYDANGDGRLEGADHISFYGGPVAAAYRKYSRDNLYWLVASGSPSPLRMGEIPGAPGPGAPAERHRFVLHHELDQSYLKMAPGPDEMDRWFFSGRMRGPGFAGGGGERAFGLVLSDAVGGGELLIRLYSPHEMEHTATVRLNGAALGTAAWSGAGFYEARFEGAGFAEGANTVAIACTSGADELYVDWFQAQYERGFSASGDALFFTHAAGAVCLLEGFSAGEVALFDISAPAAAARVTGGVVSGSGPYSLQMQPAGAVGERRYLAVGPGGVKSPAGLEAAGGARLAEGGDGADWILITERELGWQANGAEQGWVGELAALRQSQVLRTAVVDVADIFDEFGYGLRTPQAIKAFIAHAFERWRPPAPRYVLLVGDTTYDYKDNRGLGTVNRVPGYLIHTRYHGETITDDWLVQVSGADALADLHIGRLPANSAAEAAAMAGKIVAYERAANTRSWERGLVLAADNIVEEWESVFEQMNEEAAARLPAGMELPQRFYLQEYQQEGLAAADLTAELIAAISSGALVVNYSGHANHNVWADEKILDNRGDPRADVGLLANAGRYPFVVNMACLSGYFIYPRLGGFAGPEWLSLAEALLLPAERGAVAALMPTAMTETGGQQVLSSALYEGIFVLDRRVLGEAVGYAKQQLLANGGGGYEETANTFLFFGDPATALKVPLPRRPAGLVARPGAAAGTAELSWSRALDADGAPAAGYHIYRRGAGEPVYRRLTGSPVAGLSYTDEGLAAGESFFYMVTAVDAHGDESVRSAAAAASIAGTQNQEDAGPGGGGGGGCFIGVARGGQACGSGPIEWLLVFAACGLLVALCLLELRRRCHRLRA